jgi:hypothetical protein
MLSGQVLAPNILGDLRAEADQKMLRTAFLETPDYRTLIETSDRILVVGRRGTGKSALTLALQRYWDHTDAAMVGITPEEYQIIGVRPLVELFGEKFLIIRAGMRLLWRYALIMEAAKILAPLGAFTGSTAVALLTRLQSWTPRGRSTPDRLRDLMREVLKTGATPEQRIGDLPVALDLSAMEHALASASAARGGPIVFLVDKLDEGYEPDITGVALIDGLVQAAIDIKQRIPHARPVIFLRDNIFRAVQFLDPDYSRAIEGQVLRLHWDESNLLDFTAARLKIAFNLQETSSHKIWNSCAMGELRGQQGFAECLRLTLYRPRDVLALLNEAFYIAQRGGQHQIAITHVQGTAQSISQNRLDDLFKEYSAILPGLSKFVALFRDGPPERRLTELSSSIATLLDAGSDDIKIQQDFFILEEPQSVIRGLYSVGFLAVKDQASGRYIFCHDGRPPDMQLDLGDSVLIHPCYWMALNCQKTQIDQATAEDIYDEYDIEVSSETPHIRKAKILALLGQLEKIPIGDDGAAAFEVWCHKAIRICFAKSLRNVELKPNKAARQRRDVVGTNLGESGAWRRTRDDYGTRQVIFEIKNYTGIAAADYQQVQSYLGGEYGRLAFIVTRDESVDLYARRDVEWVRDIYAKDRSLIIKLTGTFFRRLLNKLANPAKLDYVDDSIHRLLDTYTRLYLSGQTARVSEQGKHLSRKKRRKIAAAQAREASGGDS